MNREIDERVVEMRFNNKQFEAGVQTSLSTLDKLKKGLDLDGAAKGFDELSNAAKKCDMSVLSRSIETISSKFSTLEIIAVGTLLKIGSQAATAGEQLIKSLTVDNIAAGWSKLAKKTTAVGTLVAQGYDMSTVEEQLKRLNWFTDETSYNFTDMVESIAKFTASGQNLEDSVTALEGVANWAALSGQNATKASSAMYQLSQAMGAGIMRKEDYKSVQNLSMDTTEFRQKALDAGVALGTLKKNADGTYHSLMATGKSITDFNINQFADHLTQDLWFTSDVMMKVFNEYSGAVDQIYQYAEEKGITASKAIEELGDSVDQFGLKAFRSAQEAKTWADVVDSIKDAVSTGWMTTFETIFGNYEQQRVLWTDLANELYDVFAEGGNQRNALLKEALSTSGFDTFKTTIKDAGIEVDVFHEKLNEVVDAKGLNLSDIIGEYGSLEEAIQNGAISVDMLTEAVVKCDDQLFGTDLLDSLADILDGVDQLSGRQHLIQAFWNTWEGAKNLLSTFKDAFREIFPSTTAEQVYNFVKGLNELTERFKSFLTESEKGQKLINDLKNTFKGVFAVLDIVKQAFYALWRVLSPVGSVMRSLLSNIIGITGSFGEWLTDLDGTIKKNDIFYKGLKTVIDFIKSAISTVRHFMSVISEKLNFPSLEEAKENIKSFLFVLKEKIGTSGLELLHSIFEKLCTRANQVKDAIVGMKNGIVDSFNTVDGAVVKSKFVQALTGIWTFVKKIASAITTLFGKAINSLIDMLSHADFNGVLDFLNTLATGGLVLGLKKFLDLGNDLKGTIGSFLDWVKDFGNGINNILDGVRGCLEAWQENLKANALLKIAGAIAILAAALLVLSTINSEKLTSSLVTIATLFVELMAAMSVLDKLEIDAKGMNKTAMAMVKIGATLLILSFAMKNLGELNSKQLAEGLIGVGVLLAEIAVFLNVAKFDNSVSKAATGMILFAAAIKILSSAVKDLSILSWEDMAKGLLGVGVLLAEVDIFLNTAKFSAKSVLTATGIVILSSAIKVLASACKNFGSMSWGEIIKGLSSIGILLLEITTFTRLTGDAKHVIATGLALIEIGTAMKIFASAMESFGSMEWGEIAKGLVVMGVALTEVAIAVKLMPKNMVGIGLGLIAVGAALKIIASVLGTMSGMSWEEIAKSLVALGGALTELSIALNTMKGTLGGSAALLVAAGALAVLTPALLILGHMSWESITKGLVAIAGAFTIIGISGAVLSPLVPVILGLSAALAAIGISAVAIGAGFVLIGSGLASISLGLTALSTALSTSIQVITQKIGEIIIEICGVITKGAPAIAEAVKAIILSLVDMLITCVPVIVDGALRLITEFLASLISHTPQIVDSIMQFLIEVLEGIARNLPQLIQAVMDVISAFFSGLVSAFSNIDIDDLVKGLGALNLLTSVVATLGLIAGMIPAAITGILGLGVAVAELAIVLAAVGALAQIPGLEWFINEGGHLLEIIGAAIGGFIGGIVGGFMSGVSNSFPQIGADLSAFMVNVQPFIDGASKINSDLLSGVTNLTSAILLITAADLLQSLTSWLTGGSSLANFGNELVPFGESMVKFSHTIEDLDADTVGKAATAGKTLAEMAATLPNSGSVFGFFAGENDLDRFGNQLVKFGNSIMKFGNAVDGLKVDAVQNAATAGKAMAELASTLPNTGGVVEFFTGNNDMSSFGLQLVPFGKAIKEYGDVVNGLKVDAVQNSAIAGKAMVELSNTIPNTGGAVAFFSGDNNMATFGTQLVIFGKSIKTYSDVVDGLKTDAITNSSIAGASLVELAKTIPHIGGLVSFFTGYNDLETFGKQLVPFGKAIKEYSDTVVGLDSNAVLASATAGEALSRLQSALPNVGGLVEFFTGGNDLGTFAKGLIPFGEAMRDYGIAVAGLNEYSEAIEASVIAGQSLVELSKTLPSVGGVVDFFTGSNDFATFSIGIKSFGKAMSDYGKAVAGLEKNSSSIEASIIAGSSLIELSKTLPNVGGVMEFFIGSNDMATFGSSIKAFGTAMKDYGEAVAGLEKNSSSIEASIIAGSSLIELSKTLPNVGGVVDFFIGRNDLNSFGNSIALFGDSMKKYGEAVKGLEENATAIKASVIAGQSLIELAKTLPKTNGVMQFFTGRNDLGIFAKEIVPFGTAMKNYGNAVAGLDNNSSAINASATAGKSLVELANTLPKCGSVITFFTGENNLSKFGEDLIIFGEDLSAYATAIRDVKPEVVTTSANAAKALSELATELPSVSLFDQWFGSSNTLRTFGQQLRSFGDDMGYYYSQIGNIDSDKLSNVVTQVWSIVDLTNGLQGLDTSVLSGFAKALKSMADNGVTEFTNIFSNSKEKVATAVKKMLDTVGISISGNKKLATTEMQNVMTALSVVIIQKGTEINASVTKVMIGVSNTICNNTNSVRGAIQVVIDSALRAINDYSDQFYTAGGNVGQGFVQGINSKQSSSATAGNALGLAALNAAKKALDSHSPSREFIYLGENMGEGLAIGAQNSIVPVTQATSKMIEEVIKVSSQGIEAFREWAEEKKYYNELSLMDELSGYENLQKMYTVGSEERKKIDRDVYRLQNELVSSTYQASIDWIEEEKYYNRMALIDELAAYKRVQNRYAQGTEERKKMNREVYRLEKEIYDAQRQYILDVQSLQLGADQKRLELQQEYVDREAEINRQREQDITNAQKQYNQDVQRIHENATQKRLDLEKEYADKVSEINNRLISNIQSLNDEYQNAVKSRTDALYRSYGLFDEIKKKEEVNSATLMKNLEGQIQEFSEWQDIMDDLSAKGLHEELIGELQAMGPSAISEIKALNSMSDDELEKYVSLWSIKHAQARNRALDELEGFRIDTQDKIEQLKIDADKELSEYRDNWAIRMSEITVNANAELDQLQRDFDEKISKINSDAKSELDNYRATWKAEMKRLNQDTNDELEWLRKNFSEKVGLIKNDTKTEVQEMTETAKAILQEAGWNEVGKQIVTGLATGTEDQKPKFLDTLTVMALEGVQAVKDVLEINSPSRVFRNLGSYTGLGFINGLSVYMDRSYDAGAEMAKSAKDGLSSAIQTVADLANGDFDIQPTIRPVLDLSDIFQGTDELNSLFYAKKTISLAGQTSIAFRVAAEQDSTIITVDNNGVVEAIQDLRGDLSILSGKIQQMQIVLDTGILIGELVEPMDFALGQKAIYRGRGI